MINKLPNSLVITAILENKFKTRPAINSLMARLKTNENLVFLKIKKQVDEQQKEFLNSRFKLENLTK